MARSHGVVNSHLCFQQQEPATGCSVLMATTNSGRPKLTSWHGGRGLNLWSHICSFIIRPERPEYSVEDDLVCKRFRIGSTQYRRTDLRIVNSKGQTLACSHYHLKDESPQPCIVYCHGNCGNRSDAMSGLETILSAGMSYFVFDFAGCGQSTGQVVSLGWFEQDDLESVINYLDKLNTVTSIGLWGRSMGAVTSLLYASGRWCSRKVLAMVLDSPFTSLHELIMELVNSYKVRMPKRVFQLFYSSLRKSIRKKAGFDIDKVAPIHIVSRSRVPAVFAHSAGDTLVAAHHSMKLHAAYGGEKTILSLSGGHNSDRDNDFYGAVVQFLNDRMAFSLPSPQSTRTPLPEVVIRPNSRHHERRSVSPQEDEYVSSLREDIVSSIVDEREEIPNSTPSESLVGDYDDQNRPLDDTFEILDVSTISLDITLDGDAATVLCRSKQDHMTDLKDSAYAGVVDAGIMPMMKEAEKRTVSDCEKQRKRIPLLVPKSVASSGSPM